jgi:integrase
MEIKTSVFKRSGRVKIIKLKDGSTKEYKIKGGWVYRLRYIDSDGRPCVEERGPFERKNDARDALNAAKASADKTGGRSRQSKGMMFADLCDICEKDIFHEARYITNNDGNLERVSGIKSWISVRSHIKQLKAFFGNRLITAITTKSLGDYKEFRRNQFRPTKEGEKKRHISQTTVNREFATMRRMWNYALNRGWITHNVFAGARVIEISKEIARQRVLSKIEEIALLAACEGEWEKEYKRKIRGKEQTVKAKFTIDNKHLRAMIIIAVDSGLRRNEILRMKWQDIDFEGGYIRIIGTNTKTERQRIAPLSDRAIAELEALRPLSGGERPFPYTDIKRSFATVKARAGIQDLHFHDLRATAGDRISKHVQLPVLAKILGHVEPKTTMKHYVGNEVETVLEVKKWLDERQLGPSLDPTFESDTVN